MEYGGGAGREVSGAESRLASDSELSAAESGRRRVAAVGAHRRLTQEARSRAGGGRLAVVVVVVGRGTGGGGARAVGGGEAVAAELDDARELGATLGVDALAQHADLAVERRRLDEHVLQAPQRQRVHRAAVAGAHLARRRLAAARGRRRLRGGGTTLDVRRQRRSTSYRDAADLPRWRRRQLGRGRRAWFRLGLGRRHCRLSRCDVDYLRVTGQADTCSSTIGCAICCQVYSVAQW